MQYVNILWKSDPICGDLFSKWDSRCRAVSFQTKGRKIDFVGNCIAELTEFLVITFILFLHLIF